jgi:hypothetical protein
VKPPKDRSEAGKICRAIFGNPMTALGSKEEGHMLVSAPGVRNPSTGFSSNSRRHCVVTSSIRLFSMNRRITIAPFFIQCLAAFPHLLSQKACDLHGTSLVSAHSHWVDSATHLEPRLQSRCHRLSSPQPLQDSMADSIQACTRK